MNSESIVEFFNKEVRHLELVRLLAFKALD